MGGEYIDIKVVTQNTEIDLGFHGKKEALELAEELQLAVDELKDWAN